MQAFSKQNKVTKYLLTIIDVFSKFVWIVLLKGKLDIFEDLKATKTSKMWVDKGRKFYNKDVYKLVELYSTENE